MIQYSGWNNSQAVKESNYYHPVFTDVIHDYKIVLEMVADGLNSTEIGYNTVWDAEMCNGLPNIL